MQHSLQYIRWKQQKEKKKRAMTHVEGAISTARLANGSCGGAAALSPGQATTAAAPSHLSLTKVTLLVCRRKSWGPGFAPRSFSRCHLATNCSFPPSIRFAEISPQNPIRLLVLPQILDGLIKFIRFELQLARESRRFFGAALPMAALRYR